MGSTRSRRLVGVHEPIDVARTDWVARADELRHPMLVIASDGDDFVPIGPAVALAGRRPDLVRFERWEAARHCREWNDDPERWERALARASSTSLDLTRPVSHRPAVAGPVSGWSAPDEPATHQGAVLLDGVQLEVDGRRRPR